MTKPAAPPPLRDYQREAIEAIVSGQSKFLSCEQGLGKTRIAIEIAKRLGAKNNLVICPATVKPTWRDEIFGACQCKVWVEIPEKPCAVNKQDTRHPRWRIINYDKLSRADSGFMEELIAAGPFDMVIIDEAHLAKSSGSQRTKAIYGAGGLIEHCRLLLPLSGTPAPNHAGELYTHLKALAPDLISRDGKVMTQILFENRFCDVEMKYIGRASPVRVIKGSKNIPELRQRLGKFFFRKTKKEVLPELPEITFTTVALTIPRMFDHGIVKTDPFKDLTDEAFMAEVQKDPHIMQQLVEIGYAKAAAAVDYIRDLLIDDHTRKAIVWFTNTKPLDHLHERLGEFHPARIDGRDSQTAREFAVHKFLNDPKCRLFCGNIKAAGTGITLLNEFVQPTDVFFVQSDFSPGNNMQAAARSHRLGQRSAVLVRTFVADGVWLDKRVQEILTRKQTELTELVQ